MLRGAATFTPELLEDLHVQGQEKMVVDCLLRDAGFHPTQAKAIRIAFYDILPPEERLVWIKAIDTTGEGVGISRDTAKGQEILKNSPGWQCDPMKNSARCFSEHALADCDGCPLAV